MLAQICQPTAESGHYLPRYASKVTYTLQESATALAEMASSVSPDACETLCVRGIVTLSKDRVWAVRVAAAAAIPAIAAGMQRSFHLCAASRDSTSEGYKRLTKSQQPFDVARASGLGIWLPGVC